MSNHATSVYRTDKGWRASCSCRQSMPKSLPNRWEAEDWVREHDAQVERAKAALGRQMTSARLLDYYAEKMEDTNEPVAARAQWKQLHDELHRRINPGPPVETIPLFEID